MSSPLAAAAVASDFPFRTGSPTHLLALGVCTAILFAFDRVARRYRAVPDELERRRKLGRLRQFVGWGCLASWLGNTGYWLFIADFRWDQSLPLQYCNLANLIGAVAVLRESGRLFKAVLYFWATTLCVWAFLTPVVGSGPGGAEFWIFWAYHLFIPLAVLETFLIQRFRPRFSDLTNAVAFTLLFTLLLAMIDHYFGWNYGFLGPSTPSQPTLLDVLGPYPLRLLWMILIATALFFAAWLPWRRA